MKDMKDTDKFITIGSLITEAEIKAAAKADYQKQREYDKAYDRQKGFIEGAKWALRQTK